MALTLRQALWRKADPAWPVCGLAATLHSDRGADFTSSHVRDLVVPTSYVQDRPVNGDDRSWDRYGPSVIILRSCARELGRVAVTGYLHRGACLPRPAGRRFRSVR